MKSFVWITGSLLLILAGCTGSQQAVQPDYAQQPDVVAVIDGSPVMLDEYEQRYVRSVGSVEAARDDSMAEYRDFLERYVNYRLKVRAAREAGYEQDSTLQAEIRDYRLNLGRPFLMEEEVMEPIIRDLYEKSQQFVDVSHILIRLPQTASPADTAAARQKIEALRDSLEVGASFAEIATKYSEDPSAKMEGRPGYEGRLGVIGAGRVIKPFEDQMYSTDVGGLSPAFRTQYGYHILKVHDRMPARAEIRVSHILIRPEGDTDEARAAARAEAETLRQELEAGADFAELARQHSEDPGSAQRGGDLNFIGYDSPLVAPFKEAAFELDEVGEVSDVVETQYGYHLIKLTDQKELPTYDEAYEELKQQAQRLPRTREAQDELVQQAYERRGARVDTALVEATFEPIGADSVLRLLAYDDQASYRDSVFATLGDSSYTFADLIEFASHQRLNQIQGSSVERVMQVVDRFMSERAMTYEVLALEDENAEFAEVMREFRDGLLLFRVMEDSVWTAASEDSVGLRRYYEAHEGDYRFPERTVVVALTASSDSLLSEMGQRLDVGASVADLQAAIDADSTMQVRIDTTYLSGPTESVYDRALELQTGEHTEPLRHQRRFIMLVNQGIEPPRAKTFEEARAEVASDYQAIVEEELMERLRDRYDVTTYPQHLVNAFDAAPSPNDASTEGGTTAAAAGSR